MMNMDMEAILDERDLQAQSYQQTLSEHITEEKRLNLDERESNIIIGNFIEDLHCLPDHEKTRTCLRKLLAAIIEKGIYFQTKLGYDTSVVKKLFYHHFEAYFGKYLENQLFTVEHFIYRNKLMEIYQDREIVIEENSYRNYAEYDESNLTIDEKNIYFFSYKHTP